MIDESALVDGFYDPPHPPPHPRVDEAHAETIEWLWRTGFLTTAAQEEHLRSFRFELYHAVATPFAALPGLVLGLKWFCWGSLADDQYDNYQGAERQARMRSVLRDVREIVSGTGDPPPSANPVITGFADYWPQLTEGLSPVGRQRITAHFMDYVQAVEFQNRYHAAHRVPDAATFLMLRRHTIAMIFQADILEVVSGLHVPDLLRDSRPYQELVWCFADITAWHNDVYGLEKDLQDNQTCNVVRVVAASERCGLDEAVDRVLERAKQRQRLLLEIVEELPDLAAQLELPPEAADQAALLARDLRAYVFANLIWIKQTGRYDLDRPRIAGTFDDVIKVRRPHLLRRRVPQGGS